MYDRLKVKPGELSGRGKKITAHEQDDKRIYLTVMYCLFLVLLCILCIALGNMVSQHLTTT